MFRHYIFLFIIGAMMAGFAVLFVFFPRPKYSEVERRELKEAPSFSFQRLFDGSYTADVSSWFSDTQPHRDDFMTISMNIKKHLALPGGGGSDDFTFHTTGDIGADLLPGGLDADDRTAAEELAEMANRNIPEADINASGDATSKMARAGILIVGKGDDVRALMSFGGTQSSANPYIAMLNEYGEKMPPTVKVYSMVVPIAMEFYCPEQARKKAGVYKSQLPVIQHIYNNMSPKVHAVNAYSALAAHTGENIYLRTDHHWAPLGAFYASQKFAEAAGVHVPQLSEFNENTIHRFVGSMYGYSKDISVKNAPEDFVYYTPKDLEYTTTFTEIKVDKDFKVTGEGQPFKGQYFKKFKDGTGNAYLTFMGSDFYIVKVETPVKNGRRLAVLKDSYGNAVPGNLLRSFEQVHVLDFRYFPRNIVEYCRANGITDLLIINNTFNACSSSVAAKAKALLTRKDGVSAKATASSAPSATSTTPTAPTAESAPENGNIATEGKNNAADSCITAGKSVPLQP